MDYREAGVDEAGRAEKRIRNLVHSTHRPEVIGGLGGFVAAFNYQGFGGFGFSTDGVQAKTQVLNCHNTVGIDLVAMCVNDVLTAGAEPLFFWIIWRLVS